MTAGQIEEIYSAILRFLGGNKDAMAKKPGTPDQADRNSLIFASTPKQLEKALLTDGSIFIAGFDAQSFVSSLKPGQALFQTAKVQLAMAAILPSFQTKSERFSWGPEIHPNAYIDPSAKISAGVRIGPGAFIGAHVVIGPNCLIGANSIIEKNCNLGRDCIIHPLVYLGAETQVGDRCEIQPNTSIGGDGFGFATDKAGHLKKIPQLGKVVLEEDVEVGANTTIDRATLTETRIRAGTKLDKHCHIAHNCEVGPHSALAGGFMMAGSSQLGAHFMCGGGVVVTDHIKVANQVMIAGRGTVTKDIENPGAYGGYPLEPLKDSLRTLSNLPKLTKLRRQLKAILQKLNIPEEI